MLYQESNICRDYAEAVFARANQPLDDLPFEPDWKDQPSRFKLYQHVTRLPLPIETLTSEHSVTNIVSGLTQPQSPARTLTFNELATLLLFAHGLLNRRLALRWSMAGHMLPDALYGRGTASGGGLYPAEIYWSHGPGDSLLPGIYHYDPAHHALERLQVGDRTERIRSAVFQHPAALNTNQFLFVTLNFWKNAFKYRNFGYHVANQDVGALLASLHMIGLSLQTHLQTLLWFQDEELNRLLGLETCGESVFAVIPLPLAAKALSSPTKSQLLQGAFKKTSLPETPVSSIISTGRQRSKVVLRFPRLEAVHRATLLTREARPFLPGPSDDETELREHSGECVLLPSPALERLHRNIGEVIQLRHSSFGHFSSRSPLSLTELGTLLFFAALAHGYATDLKEAHSQASFTRFQVFINRVERIEPGIYRYDGQIHALWLVAKGDFTDFLQQHYLSKNYNMKEIAALITIAGDLYQMLETYGNRGYRFLNIEAGLVAQSTYIAATALNLGCGAVLGFDNLAMNKALQLTKGWRSLLFLLVGHERFPRAGFDARFLY